MFFTVQNAIEVKFRIMNKNYTKMFGDQSSEQFKEFSEDLEMKVC